MASDQDWCLECGTAAPGRLASRPTWRTGTTVVALTLLIGSGAVAASYAALSSDSKRAASRPTPVASAPVGPAPATPPATNTAPVSPRQFIPPPAPVPAATPKPSPAPPKPAATSAPAATPKTSAPAVKPVKPKAKPKPARAQPILLDTNAASTYDPANHPANTFSDPANAIDDDTATAWSATTDPQGNLGAGLAIDLNTRQKLSRLRLITDTQGMSVEIYGANGPTLPKTISDPAWVRLTSRPALKARATIKLNTHAKRYRHLLVWVVRGAPGSGASPVDIAELSLFP
jgi:outer membrane biosynthesis protein TonB